MDNVEIAFKDCPLTALSKQTVQKLSNCLNIKKIFNSEMGYQRDWRGVAALAEQKGLCDETAMHSDPMAKVLELWCANNPDTATFENLEVFLGLIDRWHVIEDIEDDLQQDFRNYQACFMNESVTYGDNHQPSDININKTMVIPMNDINNTEASSNVTSCNINTDASYGSDSKLLTSNDVKRSKLGLPLQQYDAFVLYADADFGYAVEILNKLQHNVKYNLNFCLKDDLLFGILFEHVALMELIKERCSFLIVILTKEFNRSPENKFLVNYTQALQIQMESRKIIPLLYEMNVEVPANLTMYSCMRYNPNRNEFYWSKLADSIQSLKQFAGAMAHPPQYLVTKNSITPISSQTLESLQNTTEALLRQPSAPLYRNDVVLGEFRQPPYNPQYNTNLRESSEPASSTSRRRKLAIQCEISDSLYPNASDISFESSRYTHSTSSEATTSLSSSNREKQQQSNLYPTIGETSHYTQNRYTTSEEISDSSLESPTSRDRNHHTQSLHNFSTTEQATTTSSDGSRKKYRGTNKLWKKLFKR